MQNVFDYLEKITIPYERHEHIAVFGVDDAKEVNMGGEFGENKNLFLRNRKGNTHYLITVPAFKEINLDALAEKLGEKDLSFASGERLLKYLGVTRGSVSPFGLLNDIEREVIFVCDTELLENARLGFHPNINTQTVILLTEDFKKYLESLQNEVRYMEI